MTFDNTILRLREYLNTNEWAWVDIPPNSWNEIIGPIDEIGLFPKERLPTVSEADFLHGNITLTYGRSQLSGTHWTEIPRNNLPCMSRPASYEEANASVLQCFAHHWKLFEDALKEIHDKNKRFVYYCFVPGPVHTYVKDPLTMDLREAWVAMPEEAYSNPDIWRAHVPISGAALGVMLK
ncbi:hypothetical protein M422DRAFT_215250 [Sphaerobolus stellatus SS14]|uniref:Uncharacterized protein n=1 Tax=Sphaerobolus stellatus (strain SS14) TaxID=990650 RepID=A0A0C9UIW5_SPHS4|nr:hypothetical protein M422DRAFT_215250 [Sphaerobolus stellatus SS14]